MNRLPCKIDWEDLGFVPLMLIVALKVLQLLFPFTKAK